MKYIKYQIADICIVATEGEEKEKIVLRPHVRYSDEANLEKNIAVAKSEAYNGEYTIEDDGQGEPEQTGETTVWDELDAAYQEGVDSV